MESNQVVERMISFLPGRQECLALAWDRGRGEGMLVEKWILIEMLSRLVQLKREGTLRQVEGEHKYPVLKTTRYEHCDLWWLDGQEEHWLEVKTIVPVRDQQRWKKAIMDDLDKPLRLRPIDVFHHLALAWPLTPLQVEPLINDVNWLYSAKGYKTEATWKFPLDSGKTLVALLLKQTERKPDPLDFFRSEGESN